MWRAFGGGGARVGIVLKIPTISQGSLALSLLFSHVAYLTEEAAHKVLEEVIDDIRQNCEFLGTVDPAVQRVFELDCKLPKLRAWDRFPSPAP
jgi:hypothetical protein